MIPQLQDIKQDFTFAQLPTNTLKMDNGTRLIAGYADGLEAMEQAIRIILSTERYKYVIHSWNFGVELLDLFGQPLPYVLPKIKRRIREALLRRMANTALEQNPNLDTREGSVLWYSHAPAAVELASLYIQMDYILKQTLGDTADRPFLIRRAAERGLTPYPASPAVVKGAFTPPETDVPEGARFSCGALNYVITGKIADGVYKLECETPGARGNDYTGQLIPIEYIPDLASAKLTQILIPGEDEEDTETFRKRYLESFDTKAYGGNIEANIRAAIKQVKIPYRPGSGTSYSISSGANGLSTKIFLLSGYYGNLQGYYVYRSLDGGSWSQIYQGGSTSTSDYISYGSANTVQYRVYAYDTQGASSSYRYSSTKTIVHNLAPSTPSSITVPTFVKGGSLIH